jgi:hypothetical protein
MTAYPRKGCVNDFRGKDSGERPGCGGRKQKAAGIFALRLAGFENVLL